MASQGCLHSRHIPLKALGQPVQEGCLHRIQYLLQRLCALVLKHADEPLRNSCCRGQPRDDVQQTLTKAPIVAREDREILGQHPGKSIDRGRLSGWCG